MEETTEPTETFPICSISQPLMPDRHPSNWPDHASGQGKCATCRDEEC